MKRFGVAGLSVAVLFVVACSDEQPTAPDGAALAPQLSYSHSGSCNAHKVKYAAKDFFKSKKDPVFDILDDQWYDYRRGYTGAAREHGFDALREIAAARGTGRQAGDGEDGDRLTRAIIGCMSLGSLPNDFSVSAAIDHGLYEVRGGEDDPAGAALAFIAGPSSSVQPPTMWGVESSNGWAAGYKKRKSMRYLIYGAPREVNTFTLEPASVDENDVAYTGFEISTFPATPNLKVKHPWRIGICIDPQSGNISNRVLHEEDGEEAVLALSSLTFCDDAFAVIEARTQPVYRRLASRALSFLAPPEAHAWFLGGVGGLTSNLSPLGPVAVDITTGEMQFTIQPTGGNSKGKSKKPAKVRAGKEFPFEMRVTTANGTPVEGVMVELSVDRNRGIPAGAVLKGETTGMTDINGEVKLMVSIPKPGGYRIKAVPTLGGVDGKPMISELFTVKK